MEVPSSRFEEYGTETDYHAVQCEGGSKVPGTCQSNGGSIWGLAKVSLEKPGDRTGVLGRPCPVSSAILFGNELEVTGMERLGMWAFQRGRMCMCVHVCESSLQRPGKPLRPPGAGVAGSCESPDIDTRN